MFELYLIKNKKNIFLLKNKCIINYIYNLQIKIFIRNKKN